MKSTQGKLPFPDYKMSSLEVVAIQTENDLALRVSEIEISYCPIVKLSERISVTSSAEAEKLFRRIWGKPIELRESFFALFLNRGNKVLGSFLVSVGGITGTVADMRTIFQAALKANACSLILAHNHPSGNTKPSDADLQVTCKARDAGKFLDIAVLDHLIILPEGYCSMADEGLI